MARPKKTSDDLNKIVSGRLGPADYDKFVAQVKKSGLTRSEYLRRAVIGDDTTIVVEAPRGPVMTPIRREAVNYLRATSNNMNQLAKRANADNQKGKLSDANYVELLRSLRQIEMMLKQVL